MKPKKILLIDDERLIVQSTCMALKFFGYEALGALNGESGLADAAAKKPDLILLDIMMPGMDGWEVLKKLKENEATKNIPVVIFTAKEYFNGRDMAKQKGAQDLLAKPFEPEDLIKTIKKYL